MINITEDFKLEPAIATEWAKLDDLTYIIKLDENKKWENGKDVTVEDIQFTIKSIKESDNIYVDNVKEIENIEKVDENTFKIHLSNPVDFFEYLLCFPILEESTYNLSVPMGTGKFKISEMNENQIIIQNEKIKLVVKVYKNTTELYNEFTRENIDLIITGNSKYEEYIGNIGFEESIILGREFYYIDCENIEDEKIRKWINYNLNREKIVYDLYNKKYVVVDFPLEYGSYLNKEKKEENEEIIDMRKTELTLSTNIENIEIAKKIKEQLEEKEIKVTIQNYINKNADLILKKETIPITPEIRQYFNNEQTKQEIEKAVKIDNIEILKEEYGKIIDNYYKSQPFISLYLNSYMILHNNKLKGDFSGNWYNMFYHIDTWYKVI